MEGNSGVHPAQAPAQAGPAGAEDTGIIQVGLGCLQRGTFQALPGAVPQNMEKVLPRGEVEELVIYFMAMAGKALAPPRHPSEVFI